MDNIQRGDVFYILSGEDSTGSEQKAGRPGIIVSNDKNNAHSRVAEIVFLTTAPKKKLPTHVVITSLKNERTSYALCEQVHSVDESRIGDYLSTCTNKEMDLINQALTVSLGITPEETTNDAFLALKDSYADLETKLNRTLAERDVLKELYGELTQKLWSKT